MIRRILLASCFALAPFAAPAAEPYHFKFASGPKELKKANKSLEKWLKARAKREFPAKLKEIAVNQAISRAQWGLQDMRDAVAAAPAHQDVAPVTVKAPPETPCASLESCPSRVRAVHAAEVSELPRAVFAAVQPWLLLQQRRGGDVFLRSDEVDPGTLATMRLDGLLSTSIAIGVLPAPMGGFDVWLRSDADLDDIYAFSREAVLHPSEPQ